MKSTLLLLGLILLAGCSAKQKTCADQILACAGQIMPCAIVCAEQVGCVVDLCKATPTPTK